MDSKRFEVAHTDEEWRRLLTPEQYNVMRGHGTEAPGSCALNYEKRPGTFVCVGCDQRSYGFVGCDHRSDGCVGCDQRSLGGTLARTVTVGPLEPVLMARNSPVLAREAGRS